MSLATHEFLLIFLPIALLVSLVVGRFFPRQLAIPVLVISSLVFYAQFSLYYLGLLIISIIVTWLISLLHGESQSKWRQTTQVVIGVFFVFSGLLIFNYTPSPELP